ncbi:transglycosylase domain-containing protein [Marinicrinis lubricantis]|uniref:Transglycosylase domain-containing protein n=1 Tax=Marinicrinis lubricantis TaxID=2086470 RepID=A0ABW1IQL1_9BACL
MAETANQSANSKQTAKKILRGILTVMKWSFIVIIISGFLVGGAVFGYVSALVKDEPVREKADIMEEMSKDQLSGFVYFSNGDLVGQLRGIDRRLVEFDEVPSKIIDAFLAIEDDDFYDHIGIDFTGLLRAVKQKVFNEPVQTGGSTITQQVARNVFLSLERTDARKFKEILLAIRMERYLSKEQILLAYLNKVPFGNSSSGYNVYGIKAAAKGIFDAELDEINLAQAAYLAGLPKNPTGYSCFDGYGNFDEEGFNEAVKRQHVVLERMLELGKISKAEYDEAMSFDIRESIAPSKPKGYSSYPYLMIETERRAAQILLKQENPELTDEELNDPNNQTLINDAIEDMLGRGYKIYTTIDKDMYNAMQEIAQNPDNFVPDMEDRGVEQIGAVLINNNTGAIKGMIEGRDFKKEQFNHATQMKRQPGSTMKPLAAFLPALDTGKIQPASVVDDVPLIMKDWTKGYHIPNNWDNKFHGLMTAREALDRSYNIPALYLFNNVVGIQESWDFVRKLGITTITEEDNHATTGVIGGLSYGTTVEEMTNAFAAIPNGGNFVDAYMISKIEDSEGNIVYEHNNESEQIFSEETAFLMTDMLRTVIENPRGTAYDLNSKFKYIGEVDVVGKTGSTQNDRDAWFVGYSPDITVGVWAGYDQNHTLTYPREVGNLPQQAGTFRAKNIWALVMNQAYELKPEWFETKQFEPPSGVVKMTVSDVSGLLPSTMAKESGHLVTDWFNKEYVPTEVDDHLKEMEIITYNGVPYIPKESTPKDMIQKKVLITRPNDIFALYDELEDILKNLPNQYKPKKNGRNMTIADYYPDDFDMTAPVMEDPREDDGAKPAAPANVRLETTDSSYVITFTPSTSADVVGYRIYRSINGGPPVHLSGKNVLVGEAEKFTDYQSSKVLSYYITAVDVAGNESDPSSIVFNRQPSDSGMLPDPNGSSEGTEAQQNDDQTAGLPSAPGGLIVQAKNVGLSVELSWSGNASEEGVHTYHVYYSDTQDGEYRKIGTTNQTSFEYVSVPLEGWYTVTAENNKGESSRSTPAQYLSPE